MRLEMGRPSPVPWPTSLVVKNGSKMLGRYSGAIPTPVSETRSAARLLPASLRHVFQALDAQAPALRHRLNSVPEDVQEDLLNQFGIGFDHRVVR